MFKEIHLRILWGQFKPRTHLKVLFIYHMLYGSSANNPNQIRTGVNGFRVRSPRPLEDGAI